MKMIKYAVIVRVEYLDNELIIIEVSDHKAAIRNFITHMRFNYDADKICETIIYIDHILECGVHPMIHT